MAKFSKILGIVVSSLFILMGVTLFLGLFPTQLPTEVRVILSIFLFLYGAWKLVKYIMKDRTREE